MAKFKKQDLVQVKIAQPQGRVVAFRMSDEGEVFCLIEWAEVDGRVQQRWFLETQLETVS
jgi:uncharacterized protein YodC (DUF2158 family)